MLSRLVETKLRSVAGGLRSDKEGQMRAPLFLVLSAIFWIMLYQGSEWLVRRAMSVQPVGDLLVQKLLSIAFIVFLALLAFSNLVTVFTTFYLADDLQFLMSKPIPEDSLYASRLLEAIAQSSWILLIFGLPIFIAAGTGVGAPPRYYAGLAAVLIPFVVIPTIVASMIALLITNFLEATRTRDVLMFFGLAAFVVLFVAIRAMRPERLLNPESFESVGQMLDLLTAPSSAYLPSTWCMDVLVPLLFRSGPPDWWSFAMLYSTPTALFFVGAWWHRPYYERGYSKAQEGRHGRSILALVRDWLSEKTEQWRGGAERGLATLRARGERATSSLRQLVDKDQLVFIRDPSQWSQLLVVVAIIIIYLVNYKYFEIAADQKLFGEFGLFYFNLGACGFVVVALGGRFLYPAVSLEGRNFWMILQAPISLETFLSGKWLGAMTPVVVVGQLLIWTSNLLVAQSWYYCIVASVITLIVTVGVAGMAVGLGAVYPQFHNPNAAKIASSFGAVIYMILGMFVVLLVMATTYTVVTHYGQLYEGESGLGIGWLHYAFAGGGLALPFAAAAAAIKLGANSLRARM